MKTLADFNFRNKRVLVRCDFNVPLSDQGNILDYHPPTALQPKPTHPKKEAPTARPIRILDDFRIKQSIPTIEYLIKEKAKVILMSHLGRPEGKVVESLRLTPVQEKLMEYLDLSVVKASDCIGKEIEKWTLEMKPGEILLLENLRFHQVEEEGNLNFARELSKLGDIYINEAFSACHRNHASIVGIPKYLPSGAGLLLEKEIKILSDLLEKPKKPLIAIIGGKKVETKTKLIDEMSEIADFILINGIMKKGIKEKDISFNYPQKIFEPIDSIEEKDLGPKTINLFKEKISLAKTIFWAGPLGKIEEDQFQKGSKEIARAIIKSGAFSVVGGGETVEFINKIGLTEKFNHVSTGGGALLDFVTDRELPGIAVLEENEPRSVLLSGKP